MVSYVIFLAGLLSGQPDSVRFTADSLTVLVPATVMDRRGAIVPGLSSSSFTLMQDKVPQQITSFGEQDLPASIGIVLDVSGSMKNVVGEAKPVLKVFFDASNPEDEAFLYTVSTRPDLDSTYTRDFGTLASHTLMEDAGGSTALTDTIFAAVRKSRSGQNPRKALLVISDGMDNHSRYSKAELMNAAVEADLQIYSITVFDPPRNKKPIELQEERDGIGFLHELTARTGGFHVIVRNRDDILKAANQIGLAIRDQYVIGYVPERAARDGEWHSIRVQLNSPNATVYARSGFRGR